MKWDKDIKELEAYFKKIDIPTEPIKFNTFSTIENCSLFIDSHLKTVKANNGNRTYVPYLDRLKELREVLK